jgi:hypothetical protein
LRRNDAAAAARARPAGFAAVLEIAAVLIAVLLMAVFPTSRCPPRGAHDQRKKNEENKAPQRRRCVSNTDIIDVVQEDAQK